MFVESQWVGRNPQDKTEHAGGSEAVWEGNASRLLSSGLLHAIAQRSPLPWVGVVDGGRSSSSSETAVQDGAKNPVTGHFESKENKKYLLYSKCRPILRNSLRYKALYIISKNPPRLKCVATLPEILGTLLTNSGHWLGFGTYRLVGSLA